MTPLDYVFVVGSDRSGTTLVRWILNGSEQVAIAGESRFLRKGYLRRGFWHDFARIGDISTPSGAREVVNYIYHGMPGTSFWRWIRGNVRQEQFLQGLLESDRTDRALFELAISFYAGDKPFRGEKTPAHVFCVPTLMDWFPKAKIIHTLRDPRSVYVSRTARREQPAQAAEGDGLIRGPRLRGGLYQILLVTASWRRIIQLHHRYQQIYPQSYHLIQFEDLVRDPEVCVQELCSFVGIECTESMLRQRVRNSSFLPPGSRVAGFDASAAERWRYRLHPWTERWFAIACGKQLGEFGYR